MNNIIHCTPENENKTVITNTGATVHYLKVDTPHRPSIKIGPPINVGSLNVKTMQSRKPCLLYLPALPEEACE